MKNIFLSSCEKISSTSRLHVKNLFISSKIVSSSPRKKTLHSHVKKSPNMQNLVIFTWKISSISDKKRSPSTREKSLHPHAKNVFSSSHEKISSSSRKTISSSSRENISKSSRKKSLYPHVKKSHHPHVKNLLTCKISPNSCEKISSICREKSV